MWKVLIISLKNYAINSKSKKEERIISREIFAEKARERKYSFALFRYMSFIRCAFALHRTKGSVICIQEYLHRFSPARTVGRDIVALAVNLPDDVFE